MDPGLVKKCVFEVDGVGVAAELNIVTNCADTQFQLPQRTLNHRAAGLRICLYHLHANIYNYNCELVNSLFKISFNSQSTRLPYSSQAAVVLLKPPWKNSATALSSAGRPSQLPPLLAAGTPPDKLCISLACCSKSLVDWSKR